MPAIPSARASIATIRKLITEDPQPKNDADSQLRKAVYLLTERREDILNEDELLKETLHLATELEAFRGRGNQSASQTIAAFLSYLVFALVGRLQPAKGAPELFPVPSEPPPGADSRASLDLLAAHAFATVKGPRVRSRHGGLLRLDAWEQLGLIAEVIRQPAHCAHALKVAADKGASIEERDGVVAFLPCYWGNEDPDEATVTVLRMLEDEPPNRSFLVGVLQAQIELGLNDELGAMAAVDDWADALEEIGED